MKKFYMTIVAMLCGVAAMAQTCTISADPIEVAEDNDGTQVYYLEVLLNESEPGTLVTGAGFVVQFPEGVTVAKYWDDDEEAWIEDVSFPNAKSKHVTQFIAQQEAGKYAVGIGASGATYFKTATNVLFKVGLNVSTELKGKNSPIKFSSIGFAAPDPAGGTAALSVYPQEDMDVYVNYGGTGINSINAIDSKAPVYNLAGQRVSKAQKGVYIQGGKKVAVK